MQLVSLRRRVTEAADGAAVLDRELGALRADIAARRAEADQLEHDWLRASDQAEAEAIAARRRELLRTVKRDSGRIPELEAQLAAAKAAALRARLAHHRQAVAALVAPLARALEAAAEANATIIAARAAAVAELGEAVVAANIPQAVYGGLVLPDLVAAFVREQQQIWAAAWVPPPPPPVPVPSKPLRPGEPPPPTGVQYQGLALPSSGPVLEPSQFPPGIETPEAARRREALERAPPPPAVAAPPRSRRAPRKDPAPAADSGNRLIRILRPGVTHIDGTQCAINDEIALPADLAIQLCRSGAADIVGS
jgi:hypothetical protein